MNDKTTNSAATNLTGGTHGTKVAGILSIVTSVFSGLDPTVLPHNWLPYVGTIMGLITLARGFINTKNGNNGNTNGGAG